MTTQRTVRRFKLQGQDWFPTEREEETAPLCSAQLTVNAKWQIQSEVKVYDADPEKAMRRAEEVLRGHQERLMADPIPGLRMVSQPP